MQNKTLFMAFSNQKGGIGKTVFTSIAASYLHYVKGKNVAILDCDYPQYSILRLREREEELLIREKVYQDLIEQRFLITGQKAYPIWPSRPEDAIEKALKEMDLSKRAYDVILFDLSGTVNSTGNLMSIINMNYIFIPIIADEMAMASSLTFSSTVEAFREKLPNSPLEGVYHFWNKVDKRESRQLYNDFTEFMQQNHLQLLQTQIPETKKYKKEMQEILPNGKRKDIFRSTLFPPDNRLLKNSGLPELMNEICTISGIE